MPWYSESLLHSLLLSSTCSHWPKSPALGANPWRGRVFDEPNLCISSELGRKACTIMYESSICNSQCMYRSNSYSATLCTHPVHTPSIYTHSCAVCTPGMACEALASVPCESMHLARKVPVPVPSRIEATKNEKHNAHLQCDILIDFETFWYILVHVVQMNEMDLN
jgi:hypothetical protein